MQLRAAPPMDPVDPARRFCCGRRPLGQKILPLLRALRQKHDFSGAFRPGVALT